MLLLLIPLAHATRFTGYAWGPDADCTADDAALTLCWGMDRAVEPDLPDGYPEEALQLAWQHWSAAAACSGIDGAYDGLGDYGTPDPARAGIVVYWDDPADELAPGVIGLTSTYTNGATVEAAGTGMHADTGASIVFNNDVHWVTTAEADAGDCSDDGVAIEAVATHEIGHVWGLGHTCERGESCTDPDLASSTMYWQTPICDLTQASPTDYDADSIALLYGPTLALHAGDPARPSTRAGAVPFEICFDATVSGRADPQLATTHWSFGDGATSDAAAPCHVYRSADTFDVTLDATLSDGVCADTTLTATEPDYITACDAPHPLPSAHAAFDLVQLDDQTWQAADHLDTTPASCLSQLTWTAYAGSGPDAVTDANRVRLNGLDAVTGYAPLLHVDAPGAYVVVLTATGPGGASVTAQVVGPKAGGCAVAAPIGPASALGALALLLARRSRAR